MTVCVCVCVHIYCVTDFHICDLILALAIFVRSPAAYETVKGTQSPQQKVPRVMCRDGKPSSRCFT